MTRLDPGWRWIALISYSLVTGMGLAVIVSWFAHYEPGVRVIPGAAPMQMNTAICMAMLGVSGLCRIPRLSKWLAVGVVVIAAATLGQDLFGWWLGIDTLLMKPWYYENTPVPGRMAVFTAICFICAAWLTLFYSPGNALALIGAVAVIGVMALLAYAMSHDAPLALGSDTSAMAVHTAGGFVLWSIARARREYRRMKKDHDLGV